MSVCLSESLLTTYLPDWDWSSSLSINPNRGLVVRPCAHLRLNLDYRQGPVPASKKFADTKEKQPAERQIRKNRQVRKHTCITSRHTTNQTENSSVTTGTWTHRGDEGRRGKKGEEEQHCTVPDLLWYLKDLVLPFWTVEPLIDWWTTGTADHHRAGCEIVQLFSRVFCAPLERPTDDRFRNTFFGTKVRLL